MKTLKLKIFRTIFKPDTTYGVLSVDGEFFCDTIEDTDRRLEDNPEGKVYGKTAIPRGIYKVGITYSNRFKKPMLELFNVPGFTGVRIHGGRTHHDTEGCPLVGRLRGDRLVDGIAVSNRLFALVDDALERGLEVTCEVA